MLTRAVVCLFMLSAAAGCGGEDAFDSDDCTNLSFDEVDATSSTPEFRAQIEAALLVLCTTDTDRDIGWHTYVSVATGRVRIDHIRDLADLDYRTALVFEGLDENEITREQAMEIFLRDFVGYMWGTHIYINGEIGAQELAATLIHEVNHVLNRSDENYYALDGSESEDERRDILNGLIVGPEVGFVEEYRAFYVDAALGGVSLDRGMSESMAELKAYVAGLYGWGAVDVGVVPDYPTGLLVPDDAGWSARPPSICADDLTYFPCP